MVSDLKRGELRPKTTITTATENKKTNKQTTLTENNCIAHKSKQLKMTRKQKGVSAREKKRPGC